MEGWVEGMGGGGSWVVKGRGTDRESRTGGRWRCRKRGGGDMGRKGGGPGGRMGRRGRRGEPDSISNSGMRGGQSHRQGGGGEDGESPRSETSSFGDVSEKMERGLSWGQDTKGKGQSWDVGDCARLKEVEVAGIVGRGGWSWPGAGVEERGEPSWEADLQLGPSLGAGEGGGGGGGRCCIGGGGGAGGGRGGREAKRRS